MIALVKRFLEVHCISRIAVDQIACLPILFSFITGVLENSAIVSIICS